MKNLKYFTFIYKTTGALTVIMTLHTHMTAKCREQRNSL